MKQAAAGGESPLRLCDRGLDLSYVPDFAAADDASRWLESLLCTIDWRQEHATLFGRTLPVPRLTAWHGDAGVRYRYSGIEHLAAPWTVVLREIRRRVETAAGARFNAVLLNYYRDGRDSVSWHSDDEPALGERPVIASVSLGAARRFRLRPRRRSAAGSHGRAPNTAQARQTGHELVLGHGSLTIMRGDTQRCWQHCVPRCANADARVNLTFRLVRNRA